MLQIISKDTSSSAHMSSKHIDDDIYEYNRCAFLWYAISFTIFLSNFLVRVDCFWLCVNLLMMTIDYGSDKIPVSEQTVKHKKYIS